MRRIFVISTLVLPLAAVLSIIVLDDARWEAPTLLFWLVVVVASLCIVPTAFVGGLAHRHDQLELGVVAAFSFSASVLAVVHGITVPGVVYGDNMATMSSVALAIPVGSVAGGFVAHGPGRWRVRLVASGVLILVLACLLLAYPQARLFPTPGSGFGIAYGVGAFALAVGFAWRHVRLAEIAERPGPLVLAFGYLLVGGSALAFVGASMWSTYFWVAHAIDTVGVFLATIGAVIVYRRHGSVFQVLAPVAAVEPRHAFAVGLSPVVHQFIADLHAKDEITRDHVIRTAALAIDVAWELDLDANTVRHCGLVGLLHDVGKLDVPDEVLQKPGRLTDEEFAVVRLHAAAGANRMAASPLLAELAPAVRGHHERLDGRGYPDRLAGADIPLVARVVAVCDSYDAMAFTRHYREGMDHDRVRAILLEHAGAQWDPDVVDALLRVVERRTDRDTWALASVGRTDDPAAAIGCNCLPEVFTV